MVDQELDALLVGALYGELEPAEEARLAAHLESHPTDRTALDDLRSTRQALRDSRFFELCFDPPAQVSALLVQEAARRAPAAAASGEGWFMRLVRVFALHPAMAAAATLVLVVGVAGTLYMKKGADLAEPKAIVAQEPVVATAPPAPQAAPAVDTPTANTVAIGGADQGITAGLADKSVDTTRAVEKRDYEVKPAVEHHLAAKGIVVAQHEPEPKDLDRASTSAADDFEPPSSRAAAKQAPPPPPPAPVVASTPAMPAANEPAQAPTGLASGGAGGDASGPVASGKNQDATNGEDGWARNEHQRVLALVASGRCTDAAPVAAEIKARAPDYYGAYVATDRALKPCKQYIANAVEKQDAERARAEAAKAAKAAPTDSKK